MSEFRRPDGKVHQAGGYDYYTELSLWDTFRAENPLLTLTQPARVNDFVKTMLDHFKIFGQNTLPVWPEGGKETWCMIGKNADGICGNDDCGQISAWYVVSTLGFLPVDPASGIYALGSPLVDKGPLKLNPEFAKGRSFTVIARNNSANSPYLQSATLNGKPITRSWISQEASWCR